MILIKLNDQKMLIRWLNQVLQDQGMLKAVIEWIVVNRDGEGREKSF
jgi:hypothetical protein